MSATARVMAATGWNGKTTAEEHARLRGAFLDAAELFRKGGGEEARQTMHAAWKELHDFEARDANAPGGATPGRAADGGAENEPQPKVGAP